MKEFLLKSILLFAFFSGAVLVLPAADVGAEEQAPESTAPSLQAEINQQMDIAGGATGLGARDPRVTVAKFINYFLGILGILFVAYAVYAGYLWMTAGGEEEKITQAKTHLRNAVIGLAIILVSLSVTLLVTTYLIRATSSELYQPPLPYEIIK